MSSDISNLSEHDVIESLERLGLSNYAARVFIALQRLGVGTAKQIHEETDVPRSQVYGAADELAEIGLIELQQSTPKRYRPVTLDTARRQLIGALKAEADQAFSFLKAQQYVQIEQEKHDDVWTVRGREPINNRAIELVQQATDSIAFVASTSEVITEEFVSALENQHNSGVSVYVVSKSESVKNSFETIEKIEVLEPKSSQVIDDASRILLIDEQIILLATESTDSSDEETAIWSADTVVASILSQALMVSLDSDLCETS